MRLDPERRSGKRREFSWGTHKGQLRADPMGRMRACALLVRGLGMAGQRPCAPDVCICAPAWACNTAPLGFRRIWGSGECWVWGPTSPERLQSAQSLRPGVFAPERRCASQPCFSRGVLGCSPTQQCFMLGRLPRASSQLKHWWEHPHAFHERVAHNRAAGSVYPLHAGIAHRESRDVVAHVHLDVGPAWSGAWSLHHSCPPCMLSIPLRIVYLLMLGVSGE